MNELNARVEEPPLTKLDCPFCRKVAIQQPEFVRFLLKKSGYSTFKEGRRAALSAARKAYVEKKKKYNAERAERKKKREALRAYVKQIHKVDRVVDMKVGDYRELVSSLQFEEISCNDESTDEEQLQYPNDADDSSDEPIEQIVSYPINAKAK
jgi:hypothetical protein